MNRKNEILKGNIGETDIYPIINKRWRNSSHEGLNKHEITTENMEEKGNEVINKGKGKNNNKIHPQRGITTNMEAKYE